MSEMNQGSVTPLRKRNRKCNKQSSCSCNEAVISATSKNLPSTLPLQQRIPTWVWAVIFILSVLFVSCMIVLVLYVVYFKGHGGIKALSQ